MSADYLAIRKVISGLTLSTSHQANEAPQNVYYPPGHAEALNPARTIVVGDRGVGKSLWAAVLFDGPARQRAAAVYPRLRLDSLEVDLGFHQGASGSQEIAPSSKALQKVYRDDYPPVLIWQGVLFKAIAPAEAPRKFSERLDWINENVEEFEDVVLEADAALSKAGKQRLLVFDALDRLSSDWKDIQELTIGLLQVARDIAAQTKNIRFKVFLRRDQFQGLQRRQTFADFSKLSTAAVHLQWRAVDLYGALFSLLLQDDESSQAMRKLCSIIGAPADSITLPPVLKDDAEKQKALFDQLAGEFMGASAKRGRVYTWIPTHLADAHGETSLRSFLLALSEAAKHAPSNLRRAIDYRGIQSGVLQASDTRTEELKEDHPWVESALGALEGLTVPCTRQEITELWKMHKVIGVIENSVQREMPSAPIQLSDSKTRPKEDSLLDAMMELGIIEERTSGRFNVPDLFRVAAKMKRKGGVPPRKSI